MYDLKPDDLYIMKDLNEFNNNLQCNTLITPAVTSIENIGKIARIDKLLINTNVGGFVYKFIPYFNEEIFSKLCMYLMSSPFFVNSMKSITKKSGQAFYNMNKELLKKLFIPIPPLEEQERIVKRIEELMPLVDEYARLEAKDKELDDKLPGILKQSILQYAMEGKLVKQNPDDEPASVLLERIKIEKERLIKEGKIKRDKNETLIIQDDDKNYYEKNANSNRKIDVPHMIPESWKWTKMKYISDSFIGLTYKPSDICADGMIVLRSSNIKNGTIVLQDVVRVKTSVPSKLYVNKNDIIICARNGSKHLVGKSALITDISEPMTFGAFMAICKTTIYDWVYLFLQSNIFFSQLSLTSSTTTINQLTQKSFNEFLIPVPARNEMKKIISSVNNLMSLINHLIY